MAAESSWLGPAPGIAGEAFAATSASPVYRLSPIAWALVAAAVALLAVPFEPALRWLWDTWTTRPEYSHGPLLPAIALFLAWQQKDRLERLPFTGSWWGPALVLLSSVLYAAGTLGTVYTLQQYALVVALAGLALALTGPAAFRLLAVPFLVLLLMVPPPNFVLNNLSNELQLISSAVGVAMIRALGISVFLEGNVIDLGGYRLQVVEACDGMRYLFPLMTIGLLIAWFYKGATWKRVAVFLASVPITVLMNSLRVGTIGVLVEHWGVGMAEGFLHEFQGWMVFMLSAALLLGLTMLLNRVGTERGSWRERFGLELPARTPPGAAVVDRRVPTAFVAAALAVVGLAAGSALLPTRTDLEPARREFVDFPMTLGGWSGRREPIAPEVLDVLQLDDYLMADFRDARGDVANLYVAWYGVQRDRRAVHSPRACIPGGGWHIERLDRVPLGATGRHANRALITNGDVRQLVYYWFDQRGRHLTNEYVVKWFLFWDALTRQRTDGALVRVVTPIGRDESEAAAEARLAAFAGRVMPELPGYVPD